MSAHDLVEITAKLIRNSNGSIRRSAKAICLEVGVDKDVWIPISQIENFSEIDLDSEDVQMFEMPEWLAEEKELI